jgi:hypothetical protein
MENPTPYLSFLPPEQVMFGASRILDFLRATPPDYILKFDADARDYGENAMQVHAPEMMKWIEQNYTPAPQANGMPLLVHRTEGK